MLALAAGTPWDLASRRAYEVLGFPTAGNGSLMRCAPVALRYFRDPELRRRVSLRESMLTHYEHLAGWSCVALNELVVAAMAGRLSESLPAIAATLDDEAPQVAAALREAIGAEPDEIQPASFVLDSLRAAVWAVLHTTTFEGALVEIVNRGGDCDTVGAVAGALAGARYGAGAIPARWLEPLLVARACRGGGRRARRPRRAPDLPRPALSPPACRPQPVTRSGAVLTVIHTDLSPRERRAP